MMTVSHLTKTFGSETAVSDLSFRLEEHSSTALIGPNGAGKTTTLAMLTGLMKATKGTINMEAERDVRKEIGFLPQFPKVYPWLNALEFVEMSAKLSGVPTSSARKRAKEVLDLVGLKEDMLKKTATFSGGMKQRLGIAQAIVHRPKLLLLDEPVSALDPQGRREIMDLIKNLREQTTILYSTHILNDAEEMTDQLLFLKKGKLVESGSLEEIRSKLDAPRYKIRFSNEEEAKAFSKEVKFQSITEKNVVSIEKNDDFPSMQEVLSILASVPYTILKVEQDQIGLEEMYMRVMES